MMRPTLAAILMLVAAAAATASVVLHATVEELAETCSRAVVGRVASKSVRVDAATGNFWTWYRVKVEEALAGETGEELEFKVRGGQVGEEVQEQHGAPVVEVDTRAVFFLRKDEQGALCVLGLGQGVYRVGKGDGDAAVCENSTQGLTLVDRHGNPVRPKDARVTLGRIRERVRAAVERKQERERLAREALARRIEALRRAAQAREKAHGARPGAAGD